MIHQRKFYFFMFLCTFCTLNIKCSASGKRSTPPEEEEYPPSRSVFNAAPVLEPSLPMNKGKVEIMARWLWPPASLRRSPGQDACNQPRQPALTVELMGGLHNVAVLTEQGEKPGDTLLSLQECTIFPRLSLVGVGQKIRFQNLGEGNRSLQLEELDSKADLKEQLGHMPFRIPGQQFFYIPQKPGLLRVQVESADKKHNTNNVAYIRVVEHAATLTNPRGITTLELPLGTHTLQLWHPPIPGAVSGLLKTVDVQIQAQLRIKETIDFKL